MSSEEAGQITRVFRIAGQLDYPVILQGPGYLQLAETAQLPGAENLSVDDRVYLTGSDGRSIRVRVSAVDNGIITFDANHEMAGKELNFTIELLEVLEN